MATQPSAPVRSYFVDETGDGTLFDRRGRVVVGTAGRSRYFALGLAEIEDPIAVSGELEGLRSRLLAEPYFAGVPSMRQEQRKTAAAFHAKDDLPEVRREVFYLLLRHKVRFFGVVRDKLKVAEYVRQENERDPGYRYHPNELYDSLVRRLFRDLLHKDRRYTIHFARRDRSDRTVALRNALDAARRRFGTRVEDVNDVRMDVSATTPAECGGLQVIDYFLWALQRLYERNEERFIRMIWPSVCLVHDVDDTRQAQHGAFYTQRKPLTSAALGRSQGI